MKILSLFVAVFKRDPLAIPPFIAMFIALGWALGQNDIWPVSHWLIAFVGTLIVGIATETYCRWEESRERKLQPARD